MRINRFFQSGDLSIGKLNLDKDVSAHIYRVLRLKAGAKIELFNGDGFNYQAILINDGNRIVVEIQSSTHAQNESKLQTHLGQAISKSSRMDLTIQKAVELGVHEITPLFSERVQFRYDENRIGKKMKHWQKIIGSAAEQSGRAQLPMLNKPVNLEQWLELDDSPGLLFIPGSANRLKDIKSLTSVRLLVGPEGGLSDNEIKHSLNTPTFTAIQLGPRILRTETAALTAISILQSQFGDI